MYFIMYITTLRGQKGVIYQDVPMDRTFRALPSKWFHQRLTGPERYNYSASGALATKLSKAIPWDHFAVRQGCPSVLSEARKKSIKSVKAQKSCENAQLSRTY